MNRAFKTTVSLLILSLWVGVGAAYGRDDRIDLAEFNTHPETFDGRVIEISAQVIAISADSKSMELFDSQTRTSIHVRLTQLSKSERSSLMLSGARRVVVSGRATVVNHRLVIDAQKIEAIAQDRNVREMMSSSPLNGN